MDSFNPRPPGVDSGMDAAPPSLTTRQRLLRAGLELYTTTGYRATTTPMLAGRAGVAEGTIYRHFVSKEALFNEAYRGAQSWAHGLAGEVLDAAAPAEASLKRLARRFVDAAHRDAPALRMALLSDRGEPLDERSRDAARQFRERLQQIVAAGKSDGAIRSGPAELWAGVWLAIIAYAAERVSAGEWTPEHAQVGLAVDAAWDAIAARRPSSVSDLRSS